MNYVWAQNTFALTAPAREWPALKIGIYHLKFKRGASELENEHGGGAASSRGRCGIARAAVTASMADAAA